MKLLKEQGGISEATVKEIDEINSLQASKNVK